MNGNINYPHVHIVIRWGLPWQTAGLSNIMNLKPLTQGVVSFNKVAEGYKPFIFEAFVSVLGDPTRRTVTVLKSLIMRKWIEVGHRQTCYSLRY